MSRALVVVESSLAPASVREALACPELEIDLVEGLTASGTAGSDHDLLIVACAGYSDELKSLIENSVRLNPARPVLVASWSNAAGYLRSLLASGASEILQMPEDAERLLSLATDPLLLMTQETASPLIAVIGSKGGVGKTLTSVNLSVALAAQGKRVAIVDADLQFGDVGITLGLQPNRTIYDLARLGGRLDPEKLSGYLMRHPSGVDALLAPLRPEQANAINEEFLQEVWRVLRQSYDVVVVDTCPGFPPEVIAAIDASSQLCVVGALDASSLKDTRLGLETLERMGYDMSRVKLVMNRVDTSLGISLQEGAAVLGRQPDVFIPADRLITRSTNLGQPIVASGSRKSDESIKGFQRLAALFQSPASQPAAPKSAPAPASRPQPSIQPREVIA